MDRLVIEPRTHAVAISVAVVAGPPPTDGYEAISEVIVVMDEVIVIMAMPVIAAPWCRAKELGRHSSQDRRARCRRQSAGHP